MKKLMFCALILFFYKLTAQGINFETEWNVAVEKATKENKLIFMDIYTDWCRPCKIWDKKVFTDSAVGNFYNQNFINLKCNAEKGWGIKANKHYEFGIYPTFLFIAPISFEPFYRSLSYDQNAKDFIAEGKRANQYRNSPPLSKMVAEYEKGRRDMNFLKKLVERKSSINLDFTPELIEFMRIFPLEELTNSNKLNYRNVKIAFGSPEYYKIKNRKKTNTFADDNNKIILLMSIFPVVDTASKRKDEVLLERMLSELGSIGETNQKTDYMRMEFFHKLNNIEKAFSLADKYVNQYLLVEEISAIKKRDSINFQQIMRPFTIGQRDSVKEKEEFNYLKKNHPNNDGRLLAYKLNNIVEFFILNMSDKIALRKMLQWTTIYVTLESYSPNIYRAHALALYKNGEYAKANEMIKRSIAIMENELVDKDSEKSTQYLVELKDLSTKMQNRVL